MRIRFEFRKDKDMRFISHLDMLRVFERSVRRAGLPLTYSQGFNPHPKMAFGPALALGTASDREYVDISFEGELSVEKAVEALRNRFPPGIGIVRGAIVPEGSTALNSLINRARYTVKCPLERAISGEDLASFCNALLLKDTIFVKKKTKKGIREKDIRKGIFKLVCCHEDCRSEGKQAVIFCELLSGPEGSVRPEQVLEVLVSLGMPISRDYREIRRTGLYSCQGDSCRDPLEVLF